MITVALTPFRLIPFIKSHFPDVRVPIEHDSEFNQKQIKEANGLHVFFDEQSKDPKTSIGTKVEYVSNKNKIEGRIFVNPDGTSRVMTEKEIDDIIKLSKLPTWDQYVEMRKFDVDPTSPDALGDLEDHKKLLKIKNSPIAGEEKKEISKDALPPPSSFNPIKKTGKLMKIKDKEYTSCLSFEHVLETNLHLCKNSENKSGRCCFSETDWRDCPVSM